MTKRAWDKAACTEELHEERGGNNASKPPEGRHQVGADNMLMNAPTAEAQDSTKVAEAMKLAIEVGRLAHEATVCERIKLIHRNNK